MNISTMLGIMTAAFGLVPTFYKGWQHISSPERSRKERIEAIAVVVGRRAPYRRRHCGERHD